MTARREEPGQKLTGLFSFKPPFCKKQGHSASPAPWTAAPDCPKWTPWYTVEETRPARSPTLPMQKRPVVVTGRFLCLNKTNRAVLHPLRGTGHLFSACGVTPPAEDQSKSFGKGEGSMRGEGGPKRVSLSPQQTFSSTTLPRACLQTSYRSQISEAARHTKAAKTSASLS